VEWSASSELGLRCVGVGAAQGSDVSGEGTRTLSYAQPLM